MSYPSRVNDDFADSSDEDSLMEDGPFFTEEHDDDDLMLSSLKQIGCADAKIQQELARAMNSLMNDDSSMEEASIASSSSQLKSPTTGKSDHTTQLQVAENKENSRRKRPSRITVGEPGFSPQATVKGQPLSSTTTATARRAVCDADETILSPRDPNAVFHFSESSSFASPAGGLPPRTPTSTRINSATKARSNDKQRRRLSSDDSNMIIIHSPLHRKDDPYQWAYDVWKAHGLMGRQPVNATPIRVAILKFSPSPSSSLQQGNHQPEQHHPVAMKKLDVSEWDLSSPTESQQQTSARPSTTKGAARASAFKRSSTGNFHSILSRWKVGSPEPKSNSNQGALPSPSSHHHQLTPNQQPPTTANFSVQDMLRKWRDATTTLAEEADSGGQGRAQEYAREASTNLTDLITTWRQAEANNDDDDTQQQQDFEEWALQHSRNPQEFQHLLNKWREESLSNSGTTNTNNTPVSDTIIGGKARAMQYAQEASTCLTALMEQYQASNSTDNFKDWASRKCQSNVEFQSLLHHWRQARADEQVTRGALNTGNVQVILSCWERSENEEFVDWAQENARSPQELQDLLRMWRQYQNGFFSEGMDDDDEDPGTTYLYEASDYEDIVTNHEEMEGMALSSELKPRFNNFTAALASWKDAGEPDYEMWALDVSTSSLDFQQMMRWWRQAHGLEQTELQRPCRQVATNNYNNSKKKTPIAVSTKLQHLALDFGVSRAELDSMHKSWRLSPASRIGHTRVMEYTTSSQANFSTILKSWRTSETIEFIDWARDFEITSDFESLLSKWRAEANNDEDDSERCVSGVWSREHNNTDDERHRQQSCNNMSFFAPLESFFKPLENPGTPAGGLSSREHTDDQLQQQTHHAPSSLDISTDHPDTIRPITPMSQRRAKEYSDAVADNDFGHLMKSWKESKPEVLTGEHRAGSFASDAVAHQKQEFGSLMSRWSEPSLATTTTATPAVHSGQHRAKEFARDANTSGGEHVIETWKESNSDDEEIIMIGERWAGEVVADAQNDKVGNLMSAWIDDNGETLNGQRRAQKFAKDGPDGFNNLMTSWKEARPEVMTGEHRAEELVLDAQRDKFGNLMSSWKDGRDETRNGQDRAQEFAKDGPADFNNLMTNWKEARPEVMTGEHRAEELARSVRRDKFGNLMSSWKDGRDETRNGQDRAQEFAKDGPADFNNSMTNWKEARPEVMTGEHRAEELARSARRDKFGNLMSSWNDAHNDMPNGQVRAQEFAKDGPADFNNLMSNWKEARPEVMTGEHRAEELARSVRKDQFGELVSGWHESNDEESLLDDSTDGSHRPFFRDESAFFSRIRYETKTVPAISGESRANETVPETQRDKIGNHLSGRIDSNHDSYQGEERVQPPAQEVLEEVDSLKKDWKQARPDVLSGDHHTLELLRDAEIDESRNLIKNPNGEVLAQKATKERFSDLDLMHGLKEAKPEISPGEYHARELVRDATMIESDSIVSNFGLTKQKTPDGQVSTEELTKDHADDLMLGWREAKPDILTGEHRAQELGHDAELNESGNLMTKTESTNHNKANGEVLAQELTKDHTGDGGNLIQGGKDYKLEALSGEYRVQELVRSAEADESDNVTPTAEIVSRKKLNGAALDQELTKHRSADRNNLMQSSENANPVMLPAGEHRATDLVQQLQADKFDNLMTSRQDIIVEIPTDEASATKELAESACATFNKLQQEWEEAKPAMLTGGQRAADPMWEPHSNSTKALSSSVETTNCKTLNGEVQPNKDFKKSIGCDVDHVFEHPGATKSEKAKSENYADALEIEINISNKSTLTEERSTAKDCAPTDVFRKNESADKPKEYNQEHLLACEQVATERMPLNKKPSTILASEMNNDDVYSPSSSAGPSPYSSNINSSTATRTQEMGDMLSRCDDEEVTAKERSLSMIECDTYETADESDVLLGEVLAPTDDDDDEAEDEKTFASSLNGEMRLRSQFAEANQLLSSNDSCGSFCQDAHKQNRTPVSISSPSTKMMTTPSSYQVGSLVSKFQTPISETPNGKERAEEYARESKADFKDLMVRWKEEHHLSSSNNTDDIRDDMTANDLMAPAPVKSFLAALALEHKALTIDTREEPEAVLFCLPVNDKTEKDVIGSSNVDKKEEEGHEEVQIMFGESIGPKEAAQIAADDHPIIAPNGHLRSCACATSLFSGNDKLVEFFLPRLGLACSCGKDDPASEEESSQLVDDPTSVELILRPWQCEFLKTFGILRGDQLVKAHHRSAGVLAKAMKKWRKKYNLPTARTISCGLALHIWAKTSKVYVRSVRRQLKAGRDIVPPNPLQVLSHLLTDTHDGGDRRVSVPHSGRKRSPRELIEVESQIEI